LGQGKQDSNLTRDACTRYYAFNLTVKHKNWRRRPIRARDFHPAGVSITFCYRSVPASQSAVALHGRCIRACPALLTDMNCMAHIRLFLYLSVLNFTCRTSRQNRLFRVSKSRNGGPRSIFSVSRQSRSYRRDCITIRKGRLRSARNNPALGHSTTLPCPEGHSPSLWDRLIPRNFQSHDKAASRGVHHPEMMVVAVKAPQT
jgi:hypothetical protein